MTSVATEDEQRGFLRRVTIAFVAGDGLDGYDLGVISVVLTLIVPALQMTSVEAGLVAASSLIGIFVGAPIAGWVSDRVGRRVVFTIDVIAFVVLGLAQAFVTDATQLVVLRILLGVAIGAEYAVGPAMLAELTPSRGRGRRISGLLVGWFVGYLLAVVVSYALVEIGLSWRWVLATSVVPALVTFVLRLGLPESPRWLLSQGRRDDAEQLVEARIGSGYFEREQLGAEQPREGGFRALFAPGMRGRVVFVAVFWACNVAPYFAILTFAPTVLRSLHLNGDAVGTIVVNAMAAAGALAGMLSIERIGRRGQLIPTFWGMGVALVLVGIWTGAPGIVVVACFAAFSFLNAVQANLTAVYPIEVFPTEVRSIGTGFAAACSRIAAAIGTFLLPVGIDTIGTAACMLIAAGICVGGAVLSQRMAPETTGKTLGEAIAMPV